MPPNVMAIDTQQIVNALTAAGFSEAHADAIASVVARTAERHRLYLIETLCSKLDLNAVEVRLTAKIDGLESKMVTKTELSDAVSRSENKIILWVVGALILAQLLPDFLQRLGMT